MNIAPEESDLLLPFERLNIKNDYRVYYAIKRNNFFASIQNLPEHWEFFCKVDEILRREIGDLEVTIDGKRALSLTLYINAHAKMRISMELAFSNCIQEARSILRDAIECVAHAHHILRDDRNRNIWLEKDGPLGKAAFKNAFESNKGAKLFAGLGELYEKYGELSEAGSHPTPISFANRVTVEDRDGERHMIVKYSGASNRRLFAIELFSRLLTCFVIERTFFEDFKTRLELDVGLMRMRQDFEVFKESLRRTLITRYKIKPPKASSFSH